MRKRLQRLSVLIRKETTQLLRDRRLLLFILGLPVIQLILYGYAAHLTVYHLPLAVADQSRDARSRAFVAALANSQFFDPTLQLESQAQIVEAIDRGQAKVGLLIPPGFAAAADRGGASVQIVLDGSDTASVQSGYGAAALVAQQYALQLTASRLARGGTAGSLPINAAPRVLYNPALIDIWFILPGLVGLIVQTLAITQAALIVVRERELGTIEQILITPTRPLELMLSKIVPLLALCLVAMLSVVAIGVFWFGVPFHGSLWLYFGLALVFIISSLGLGLLLSARASTQAEATQYGLIFMLVGILMSGFMYPPSAMPAGLRALGGLFPVTYFIRISRAIFLKGVGLRFVWSDAAILLLYSLVVVVAAARSFKPRLD
ncbi:MAG TPA: ABC transporter permease [Kouleothrix sp.]|uniref:ABC transporter permease n=1 Tax=Kouleothrix sp. TaxID=2779161 RepID=UPI002C9C1E6A|nr:ABC transporter permease [Kouleothrix sp.]HRC74512.1 ABC transporter permease [Kouleothrix sp.]